MSYQSPTEGYFLNKLT